MAGTSTVDAKVLEARRQAALKKAQAAAAERDAEAMAGRAVALEAAQTLGRRVLGIAGEETDVEALLALIDDATYGPDPGPEAAPWSPPGLAVPRLWAGGAHPFGELPPAFAIGFQAEGRWETGIWMLGERLRAELRPHVGRAVRALLAEHEPRFEAWSDVVGTVEPVRQHVRPKEPMAAPPVVSEAGEPAAEAPPADVLLHVRGDGLVSEEPPKEAPAPATSGWLREAVQGWVVEAVLGRREPEREKPDGLVRVLGDYAKQIFARVPETEWAAFRDAYDGDPLGPVSAVVWQEAEQTARYWRALRGALYGPDGVPKTDEARCCEATTADEFCFQPDDPFDATSSVFLPTLPVLRRTQNALKLIDLVARKFHAELGSGAESARRIFAVRYFGPGLGDQLAAFGALSPEHRDRFVPHLLPDLDARRGRGPIATSPLPAGAVSARSPIVSQYRPGQEFAPLPSLGCCPEDDATVGTVTIFGAGVAGLTAAHELAERGFAVQVVEAAHGQGLSAYPLVGGMARTQWAVEPGPAEKCCDPCEAASKRLVPAGAYALHVGVPLPGLLPADPERGFQRGVAVPAEFLATFGMSLALLPDYGGEVKLAEADPLEGRSGWLPENPNEIKQVLREVGAGLALAQTRDRARARLAGHTGLQLEVTVATAECGRCGQRQRPVSGDGLVELVMRCGVLPGEHGYRFFPSFYRHLFDTMGRTPIYTADGFESRHKVLDNLVSTFQQVLAGDETRSTFTRDRPRNFEAFRREYVAMLEKLGFEKRDITRLLFRVFRFLTTSSERRSAEFEDITWWQFLTGGTKDDPSPRWQFSPAFEHHLKASPQALGGVDATWGDARTQGNVTMQLLLDQFSPGGPTDSTLNGPTSLAWLELWKLHLQTLGVRFYAGTLKSLCPPACPPRYGQPPASLRELLKPCIQWPNPENKPPPCFCERTNYYLLATDVVTAEEVTSQLRTHLRDHGVPGDLNGYTTRVPWDGPPLLPRRYFRLVVADRLPEDKPATGLAASEMRSNRVTPVELLPLVADRAVMALSRLRQLHQRQIGQIETVVLRNRPGEARVARIVVETTDSTAEIASDLSTVLGCWKIIPTNASLMDQIALWSVKDLEPEQKVDFGHVRLVEEPEEDRLAKELERVVRRGRRYGDTPRDRLQTFAGIQYYFDQDIKVARGHVFYHDTEWGLSSISQLQFWQSRRILRDQGIRGILSVDIGDWRTPSRYLGKPALDCNAREIADEVWRQIAESLRRGSRFGSRAETLPIPQPKYWYLDEALKFGHLDDVSVKADDGERLCIQVVEDHCDPLISNTMPFLVNNVSDWAHRPGAAPMDPDLLARKERKDEPYIWQADHGGYQVHFGQLLFAGTYLRTFTRMTTMEAANESARHAVNALLDHATAFGRRSWMSDTRTGQVVLRAPGQADGCHGEAADAEDTRTPEQQACRLDERGVPLPVLAIAGDYCDIWDPEKHELEDLAFFKRVDELLYQMGKPHLADILCLDDLVDRLHPTASDPGALLAAVLDTLKRDFAVSTEEVVAGGRSVEALLQGLRTKAEGLMGRLKDALKP